MDWIFLAESPPPTLDTYYWVALIARVLHTLSGATLLGGIIFLRFILLPSIETADDKTAATFHGQRAVWARLVMLASLFLLVSGTYNIIDVAIRFDKVPGFYHMILGIKILIALFIMFIAAALAGTTSVADGMRKSMRKWLNLALAAIVAVFVMAAVLRSFPHNPKPADNAQLIHSSASLESHYG